MKGPIDRSKVVLRHLPPTISQSDLVEHLDSRFSGRYRWLSFVPGKPIQGFSRKHLTYSRAYINFNKPEDVIEFAEFFNGHVFVNEKGTQFKAIVEYAPSQRVPKQWSKNDGREGTILRDPDYLEFLEFLEKPVENLPSAEIQFERKEAERRGAPNDVPIVTPLMDYVRQKRAAKVGSRRTVLSGKPARRVRQMSSTNSVSGSLKSGSEERRTSTMMYVSRDSSKIASSKDKSTYSLAAKKNDQLLVDKSIYSAAPSGNEALDRQGGSGSTRKILLLNGNGKEISNNAAIPAKFSHNPATPKQNPQREASRRIIKGILLNRDAHHQPSSLSQSDIRIQSLNQDRERKSHLPPTMQSFQKDTDGVPEAKVVSYDFHSVYTERQERRTRNKDRPNCGVWTPHRRSDGSLLFSSSETSQVVDTAEGTYGGMKHGMLVSCGGGYRRIASGRGSFYSVDDGSHRHRGCPGSAYNVKDADGSQVADGKPSKSGGSSGYGSYEKKQVWVQKSSSGT